MSSVSPVIGPVAERRERGATIAGMTGLIAVLVGGLAIGEPYPAFAALMGMGFTIAPWATRRYLCLPLPWALTAVTAVVTFLHAFGILVRAYDFVWWWDIMTHFMAIAVLALVVNLAVLAIGKRYPEIAIEPRRIPLVSLGLAIALGVLWEVLEFLFDGLLGMTMQYSLSDTAVDLSIDILGAVSVAVLVPPFMAKLDEDYGMCELLIGR